MAYLKILFLLFISTNLFSTSSEINNKMQIDLLSSSKILIDEKRGYTIDKIVVSDDLFKKNDKNILSFGYSPNFDVWIKFTLKNSSNN